MPDVINVKCGAGREYSAEIAFEDKPIYYHTGNRFFETGPEKIIKNAIVFRCVYWNKKGSYDFIKCLFLKQGRYDKSLGSFTSEDTVPETVKDTPPIPTEKAWEGWHKLTISARQ